MYTCIYDPPPLHSCLIWLASPWKTSQLQGHVKQTKTYFTFAVEAAEMRKIIYKRAIMRLAFLL